MLYELFFALFKEIIYSWYGKNNHCDYCFYSKADKVIDKRVEQWIHTFRCIFCKEYIARSKTADESTCNTY